VDGCVCWNSPRPCESRSHLSGFPSVNVGLAPPAWQWRLGGEDVTKHLSIGSVMRLLGVPRLPLQQFPPRAGLDRAVGLRSFS
jgi:hypothetical protein